MCIVCVFYYYGLSSEMNLDDDDDDDKQHRGTERASFEWCPLFSEKIKCQTTFEPVEEHRYGFLWNEAYLEAKFRLLDDIEALTTSVCVMR